MPPSKNLASKHQEALAKWEELVQNGEDMGTASIHCGFSVAQMARIRKRYRPDGFEQTLKENNLPDNWNHGWLKVQGKDGEPSMSIHIKNQENIVTLEEMKAEFIESVRNHVPKYPKIERPKLVEPHLLVMDIADPHIGKYSSPLETGELYDIDTAKRRATEGLHGLLQKSSGFPVDKILFVIGNDALHVDNPRRTTTSGTPQDTDRQWYDAYLAAKELYVYMLEVLIGIADVHVVFNPSNHDYMSGGMLAESIQSWFRECEHVTFDVDMRHRKYFRYGKSLIGTTHGDGAKEGDLSKLMATEARELWSQTEFAYWYCHHKHHKIAKDDIGATVEYLRSPSSADSWHSRNGYVTKPAVECFVHSADRGQIARITHYC